MKYYLLNWEEKGNPVPRIRNWMERLDYQAVQRRELAKLPERTIHFLEENQDTLFSDDYSVIQELILDKEKIKYVPPVFEVAEVEKDYLICRLDFIESILRRGAKGIKLAELKVE